MLKTFLLFLLSVTLIFSSCGNSINKIFGNRTPHEAYADKVKDSPEGKQWLAVAKNALKAPHTIQVPYKLMGYFHAGRQQALALQFSAKRGERVEFSLNKRSEAGFVIYADLFKQDGTDLSHLLAADTTNSVFGFDADETANYILRLQPELYRTGEYSLSASVVPSLGFPVAGKKAKTGSFWGDARDGGQRRHEGIDIFAPKLTPAIAATDGYITGVQEGGIGGKTIWLRAANHYIHLYYAHLDKQLVQEGQSVKKGDTLGLVGNTGNAKYTPSHLHFGIYTSGGPIDPLPYVNKLVKIAPDVEAKNLTGYLTLKNSSKIKMGLTAKDNDTLIPLAVTGAGYITELPDGRIIQTPFESVIPLKIPKGQTILAKEKTFSNASGG